MIPALLGIFGIDPKDPVGSGTVKAVELLKKYKSDSEEARIAFAKEMNPRPERTSWRMQLLSSVDLPLPVWPMTYICLRRSGCDSESQRSFTDALNVPR